MSDVLVVICVMALILLGPVLAYALARINIMVESLIKD